MTRRTAFILALVASMILAACGEGEDAASDTTAAVTPTTAAAEPSTTVAPQSSTTMAAAPDTTAAPAPTLTIVATTTILGDVVANVVGDFATVEVIMGPGTDPHDFQPSAQQAELIQTADLVVANGLGLEEGLLDVIETAEAAGTPVLELADMLDPIPFGEGEDHDHSEDEHEHSEEEGDHSEEEGDDHAHEHGSEDPHFWQDPTRMATAAGLIADELTAIDAATDWSAGADAYAAELTALDAEITELLSGIPDESRKIVTNHEAFGYFADRYGFTVIGTVIPGGSTLAEPSAAELADLIAEIEEEGVTAVFAENTNPSALADAVAAELGTEIGVYELYSDSLGEPGSEADTYIGMIRANATTVAEALS